MRLTAHDASVPSCRGLKAVRSLKFGGSYIGHIMTPFFGRLVMFICLFAAGIRPRRSLALRSASKVDVDADSK